MASNAASSVAGTAGATAQGVKDSVFSMFGGGAKKEKKEDEGAREGEDEDRSGSSKAKRDEKEKEKENEATAEHEDGEPVCSSQCILVTQLGHVPALAWRLC